MDINKNLYFINIKNPLNLNLSFKETLDFLDCATKMLDIDKANVDKLKLENWELDNKYNYVVADKDKIIENKEKIIKEQQSEIDKLNIELQSIYFSRSYKLIKGIKRIFNKK